MPLLRSAELEDADVPRLAARDLVFSGTSATGAEALALVRKQHDPMDLSHSAHLPFRQQPIARLTAQRRLPREIEVTR